MALISSRCSNKAQAYFFRLSNSGFCLMEQRNLERQASKRPPERILSQETGTKGQGSTKPWEFICNEACPAAEQIFSSPYSSWGNWTNTIGLVRLIGLIAITVGRCAPSSLAFSLRFRSARFKFQIVCSKKMKERGFDRPHRQRVETTSLPIPGSFA